MAESRPVPCSVRSRERAEPLLGTASQVRRWLVVEQPGPWGRDALGQSRMPLEIAAHLAARARSAGVRVLLARRPGWDPAERPRRVHLASTRSDTGWVEHVDLRHLRDLLAIDLQALDAREAPGIGAPGPHPLLLVCTHGRHDACCANEGRPVVRALVAAGITDVWESSHVGGDRFAANVVALPWGVYLGRVPADRAVEVVTDLRAGLLHLPSYRGRSCHPPLVQAADVAARLATGERRVPAVAVERVEVSGEHRARVTLRVATEAVEVVVSRHRGEPMALSCGAEPGRPWVYEVEGVRRA
jgi:hypothetical protein